jgi:hypothetical protein
METFMKFQVIFATVIFMLSGASSAQGSINYGRPAVVTATAKCNEGQATRNQWFSLLEKLGMEPSAAIAISAAPDGTVKSTELTYSGRKSGVTSASAVAFAQREITSLASSTHCKTSFHITQIASGS